jgi:hypothetical protein
MNTSRLLELLIGIRKDADSDIRTIKAGAFDRICAEMDRAQYEAAEMDELLNAVNPYHCDGSPAAVPVPAAPAPEGPFYVLMTPEAAPENTPPAAEEPPAAPQVAEDPGVAPRRRGRPRKAMIEEPAPVLLSPPAPEESVEAAKNEPAEPVITSPAPDPTEDDIPW